MDLSGVVLGLASGSYSVARSLGGYDGDGRYYPGTISTFNIQASVQPLKGRDLLRLPEGLRTEELVTIYTPTQLFTQGANQDPDVVTVAGLQYQVQTVEQWGPDGSYWKAIAAKLGRQG